MRLLVLSLGALALAACEPKEPSCSDVSTHVGRMFEPIDDYSRDVEGVFLNRCVSDAWTAEVRRCVASTTSITEPKGCRAKLSAEQGAALDKDLEAAERRDAGRVLPKVCLDLEVQVAAAMACEAIAKPERERIATQLETSKAAWKTVVDKQRLAPSCAAAIQALRLATLDCKPPTP